MARMKRSVRFTLEERADSCSAHFHGGQSEGGQSTQFTGTAHPSSTCEITVGGIRARAMLLPASV
jgi:hypothetical protein